MIFMNKEFWVNDDDDVLQAGLNHSTDSDEGFPWFSVHEVSPGLFLTCESRVEDKIQMMEEKKILILNFCAPKYSAKYKVYKRAENKNFVIEKHDQETFTQLLNDYTSRPISEDPEKHTLFVCSIAADDESTYDIGQHFMESSYLIELVLSNRRVLEKSGSDALNLPSVVVHCLVGMSRSAAVVAAYLMKKHEISSAHALRFLKSVRPVVKPNPGFLQHLESWEHCRCRRSSDLWSALRVAEEIKVCEFPLQEWREFIFHLLTNGKLKMDREWVGIVLKNVSSGTAKGDVLLTMRDYMLELHDVVRQLVDDGVNVDIPNLFVHLCEIQRSIELGGGGVAGFGILVNAKHKNHPSVSKVECTNDIQWSDEWFPPYFHTLLRGAAQQDVASICSAVTSMLVNIHQVYHRGECPSLRMVADTARNRHKLHSSCVAENDGEILAGSTPPNLYFSFSFLLFLAPLCAAEVVSLESLMSDEETTMSAKEHFEARCTSATSTLKNLLEGGSAALRWVNDDVEAQLFLTLVLLHTENELSVATEKFQQLVRKALSEAKRKTRVYAATLCEKICGAICGFRLLLEVCEGGKGDNSSTPSPEHANSNNNNSNSDNVADSAACDMDPAPLLKSDPPLGKPYPLADTRLSLSTMWSWVEYVLAMEYQDSTPHHRDTTKSTGTETLHQRVTKLEKWFCGTLKALQEGEVTSVDVWTRWAGGGVPGASRSPH